MLEVKNLTKTFDDVTAVDDVSFSIREGEILGMIGQNGAGKTTTFRLILNFLTANQGEILWQGRSISKDDYNTVGYLPEERGLYPKESIENQIFYFAKLRGKSRQEIDMLIDEWMQRFEVKGKRKDKIKSLSKGNQQKVQIITTLIHEPKLVILDEPFSGLDPVNAGLLKQAIFDLKKRGACVIFSSHNMDNVAEICDSLVMLRHGKVVLNGSVNSIRESFGRTKLYVKTELPIEELQQIDGVVETSVLRDGSYFLRLAHEDVGRIIFEKVTKNGYIPVFNQEPPTLEEIFKLKAGEPNE